MNKELALNLQNWKFKPHEQIVVDFASALNEQKDTPNFIERLSSGELYIENGRLCHPIYGTFKLRDSSLQDNLENTAVGKIIEKAQAGKKHIVWISPPSEAYSESRLLIYFPQTKENDEKLKLEYISIPAPHDLETCLFTARQLQAFSGEEFTPINSEEELRSTPISFEYLTPYENWIDLMEDSFFFPEMWQAIKEGKHIINAQESQIVSEKIVAKYYNDIQKASGLRSIEIGALMEIEAEKYGYRFQANGSCGRSNRSFLDKLSASFSPFSFLATVLSAVEKWEYHNGSCRICGKDGVEIGPCGICKECEKKFKNTETSEA
jgi:hypothetical protein